MDSLSTLLLRHRCKVTLSEQERQAICTHFNFSSIEMVAKEADHPMWHNLYYGVKPRKARAHLAALSVDFPEQAAIFTPAVEAMLVGLEQADKERAERKAVMQKRREERAARASQRASLGVDLQKKEFEFATVETYNEMRAGLKPVEDELCVHLASVYTKKFNSFHQKLVEAGFDAGKAFPTQNRDGSWDTRYIEVPHPLFWKLFVSTAARNIVKARETASEIIAAEAKKDAGDMVAGFAGKLAAKVDRELCNSDKTSENRGKVLSVRCEGDMWNNSVLTVTTDRGIQIWNTHVIINTSCLGKCFNQWPTRRVDNIESADLPRETQSRSRSAQK